MKFLWIAYATSSVIKHNKITKATNAKKNKTLFSHRT